MQTRLRKATETDLSQVAGWFDTAEAVRLWGGPLIRFPLQVERLKEDISWGETDCFSLVDESGCLLGFGQVMDKFGCRHLGRIAIVPNRRGQGLGSLLIRSILQAAAVAGLDFSLFVYSENLAARKLYQRYGFVVQPSPSKILGPDSLFMVKKKAG